MKNATTQTRRAQGLWRGGEPLGFEAGDANFYRYVGDDPTNATDPSGLKFEQLGKFGDVNISSGHPPSFEMKGPIKVGDIAITIRANPEFQLLDPGTKEWFDFPAPGIIVEVDAPDAATAGKVKFVQFHRFEVRYWGDWLVDNDDFYGVYQGKLKTEHGEHVLSSVQDGQPWYVDSSSKDSPEYVSNALSGGVIGNKAWFFDAPTSPAAALGVAWEELKGRPTLRFEAFMYASTYVVVDGRPIFRIDWVSRITRRRYSADGKPNDSSWISITNATSDWAGDKGLADIHFHLLDKYPASKRVWTTPPGGNP